MRTVSSETSLNARNAVKQGFGGVNAVRMAQEVLRQRTFRSSWPAVLIGSGNYFINVYGNPRSRSNRSLPCSDCVAASCAVEPPARDIQRVGQIVVGA